MARTCRTGIPIVLLVAACGVPALRGAPVDYERDIKPLLRSRCLSCHGALKQEGGLRLDTGERIRAGGTSGPAVTVGQPDDSLLWKRTTAEDPAERMPPDGDPLTSTELDQLREWIRAGAASPAGERADADPRDHWAFQPPRRVPLPVAQSARAANPIDAFIEAELAQHGLVPRPPASPAVLLRRVYLDLLGVPPTESEVQAFLADTSPNAYEQMLDRLLADGRYGERWGRHWMDVWRYSDWYGRRDANDVRNSASQIFRWRDWIVQSLNAGHGYDRMVREMLAADEICPEDYETGVATGYLIRNYFSLNPNEWMRSTVEHTGKAFLGLTFQCAHCHDHKYDPISQEDYFRLRAFFEPLYIRQDRVPGEADPGVFQDYTYAGSRSVQRLGAVRVFDRSPQAPTWFYTGGDERNRLQDRGSIPPGLPEALQLTALEITPVRLPPTAWYPGLRSEIRVALRADVQAALERAEAAMSAARSSMDPTGTPLPERKRRLAEVQLAAARAECDSLEARLAADVARFEQSDAEVAKRLTWIASRAERQARFARSEANALAAELAMHEAEAQPAGSAQRVKAVATAEKAVSAAYEARRQAQKALLDPKQMTSYSPLSPTYPAESTGRRRALAHWITRRDNPLTARVAVNHIWTRHFHAPQVASLYDFGRNGARPVHPVLLDWLAVEFMDSGWDMKYLHRLIVTSEAYRRVSSVGDAHANVAADPENRLLWRMNVGRMEAEVVRDSLLFIADRLDLRRGGVEIENKDALTTYRRSLYYSIYPEAGGRSALGELFDGPDPRECYRRVTSIVPQQALALTNSDLVHEMSGWLVQDWQRHHSSTDNAVGPTAREFVDSMFIRILNRPPSEAELCICLDAVVQQQQLAASAGSPDADVRAFASLVRVLFNHNDFLAIR